MSLPPPDDRDVLPAPAVLDRDRIHANVRRALFGGSEDAVVVPAQPPMASAPSQIGRFLLDEELGRGSMGVVWSAYDPELQRKVALKLLRADPTFSTAAGSSSRLIREAQALARLNHPHVIAVHEVGVWNEQPFVAMELVEGQTLTTWLGRPHPWLEIVQVFVQAGQGLAAAHAAGLVHRDFKPDNVLIGHDGRVRVVDFGLARVHLVPTTQGEGVPVEVPSDVAIEELPTLDAVSGSARGAKPSASDRHSTRAGTIVGTPAFMSPEQHEGRQADARSDQFSFCVALWEALAGERPFVGRTYPELAANVVAGRRRPPPRRSSAPKRCFTVLQRGLQRDPSLRYASMEALLADLQRMPSRRWQVLGLGGMAVAAIGFGAREWSGAEVHAACERQDGALGDAWSEDRKLAVQTAFESVDTPWAEPVWRSASQLLDTYATAWRSAAREACAAGLLPNTEPDMHMRRIACLEARRAELDQLTQLLSAADESIAVNAVEAAAMLPDPHMCSDPRTLAAWTAPADPAASQELARLRGQLALARAQGHLGRHDDAIATAESVLQDADALGDPATQAAALLVRGHEQARKDDPAAESSLRQALERATGAGAHAIRAEATIRLVEVSSRSASRYDEAVALAGEATAVLQLTSADPLIRGKLEHNLGIAAHRAGRHDEALRHFQTSLETFERTLGPAHPETARAMASTGTVLAAKGQLDEAEPYLRQALERFEVVLGGEHPTVGSAIGNLGTLLARREQFDESAKLLRRALEIKRRGLPDDHASVTRSMFNLGVVLHQAERYDEALALLTDGYARRTRKSAANSSERAMWCRALGRVELSRKNHDAARDWLQQALAADEGAGQRESDVATDRFLLAQALQPTEPAQARAMAIGALRIRERELERAPDDATLREEVSEIETWLAEAD